MSIDADAPVDRTAVGDRAKGISMDSTRLALCAIALLILQGCASVSDDRDKVVIREPGSRIDGAPQDLKVVASRLYPYAAMSMNVYKHETAQEAIRLPLTAQSLRDACPNGGRDGPGKIALPIGNAWHLFTDFPKDAEKLDLKPNLRVQLWGHRMAPGDPIDELVLAFRGTQSNHLLDWISNFRWFGRTGDDHYTRTKQDVARELQQLIADGIDAGSISPGVRISTTGHSLGGGLAQHMAYAFLAPAGTAIVPSTVVAFDPSPVTGWHELEPALRERNAEKLCIERVFEDGEILWYVREAIAAIYPPSETSPAISGVRLSVKRSPNPFSNHSMPILACALAKAQVEAAESQGPGRVEASNESQPGNDVALGFLH